MNKVILIFKKEILDAVRDSRTFFVCVITPFLLYPILFMVMGYFMQSEKTREARLIYKIGSINQSSMPTLLSHIESSQRFDIIEGEEPLTMFRIDKVKAVLEVKDKNKVVVYYDGADKESQNALKRIEKLISEYQNLIIKKRILKAGLTEEILKPIAVEKENIAPSKRMGGYFLGILIPYMLIIVAFQGAMRAAIDLTAGEKERKTIETLLVTDVKRGEIVIGKCLTVFVLALLSIISGLLGLVITMQSGFSIFTQIEKGFAFTIPWLSCLLMLIVMLPILWFFSSALIAIGSASRSIKQATTYGSYCLIVVIVLAVFSVLRITSPGRSIFLIPVLNTAILQQQILIGEVKGLNFLITMGSSIIYAGVAYLYAKHNFEKEEILLRS
ncbi:ABC transporter permease [candidate division WOR-3 bacterium]|nr:ABC transporter permease [candidate division WOR-3 bacterium]